MRNLAVRREGAALSMVEAAVEITGARISATDLRIVALGKELLRHPVNCCRNPRSSERSPRVRGRADHQGRPVPPEQGEAVASPISSIASRSSAKDASTYARVLGEFDLPASRFAMIGNSLGLTSHRCWNWAAGCVCPTT
jgi:putative hydrolase of the HAD superfamily